MVGTKDKDKLNPDRIAAEMFVKLFHAYTECSDEVQGVISDMVEIIASDDADDEEKEAAHSTLIEALFPKQHNGDVGIDLEDFDNLETKRSKTDFEALELEEATFATRLQSILDERGMTQEELAGRIGVGQSAVSMFLARKCRPQYRTVEKIAKALGMEPNDLWPRAQ